MQFVTTLGNPTDAVDFKSAILSGQPAVTKEQFRTLYTLPRNAIPTFVPADFERLKGKTYSEIALEVLYPLLHDDFDIGTLETLVHTAYPEEITPTIKNLGENLSLLELTKGPTYSFKDYAARFFGQVLNHYLTDMNEKRMVLVATSGDTGGAVASALHRLDNVDVAVFYPNGEISEGQRRQMTTLGDNVHAISVDGDFDLCQHLVKSFLQDKAFAKEVMGNEHIFTTANSISLGRLLPQIVFPFYAFSQIDDDSFIPVVPSGNFGDMMGTVIAKDMGLPIEKIVLGLNATSPFPNFYGTHEYTPGTSFPVDSSAMKVTHPSNLARLVHFYGGQMVDTVTNNGTVTQEGKILRQPDWNTLYGDISLGIVPNNEIHRDMIAHAFREYQTLIDPHTAVGLYVAQLSSEKPRPDRQLQPSSNSAFHHVVYATADPGKFPRIVQKATGVQPEIPNGMQKQVVRDERIYQLELHRDHTKPPLYEMIEQAKAVFSGLKK